MNETNEVDNKIVFEFNFAMNQKEILTIGIIIAFVFAATIALLPAEAQNSIGQKSIAQNSDDDVVTQSNDAEISQSTKNKAIASGIGNTATTTSSQTAATVQSNTNTDNDVQVSSADTCLEVC